MIDRVLQDPVIVAENVCNMDEIGVMLFTPGSIKVLICKNDTKKMPEILASLFFTDSSTNQNSFTNGEMITMPENVVDVSDSSNWKVSTINALSDQLIT